MTIKDKHRPKDDLSYYLTLFKIEGHSTWRASIKEKESAFTDEVKRTPKFPKISEMKVFKIDRIIGEVSLTAVIELKRAN